MTEPEFDAWADAHCTVLGINFPDDRATVGSWFDPFTRSGYTIAELRACTEAMTVSVHPVRLSEQLAWINDFIRRIRNRIRNGCRRDPLPQQDFDRNWFRSEVEKLFPSQRWTDASGKKRKRSKATA